MSTPDASAEVQQISKPQVDAILVLIKAVNLAQSRGSFSLDEARLVADACDKFIVKNEQNGDGADLQQRQSNQITAGDFSKLRMDAK